MASRPPRMPRAPRRSALTCSSRFSRPSTRSARRSRMEAATLKKFGSRGGERRLGDRLFSGAAVGAGIAILTVLAGVAIFLLIQALPSLSASQDELLEGKGIVEYIAPIAFGTVL